MKPNEAHLTLVVIESPLAGDVARNTAYARAAMRDALKRGEAPYASHLLFAQPGVLDDTVSAERELGIMAGFAWGALAELRAIYVDLGISNGMSRGMSEAERIGQRWECRSLGPDWRKP